MLLRLASYLLAGEASHNQVHVRIEAGHFATKKTVAEKSWAEGLTSMRRSLRNICFLVRREKITTVRGPPDNQQKTSDRYERKHVFW